MSTDARRNRRTSLAPRRRLRRLTHQIDELHEEIRRLSRRVFIGRLTGIATAFAGWLFRPQERGQGRDVRFGGTLDHGIRAAGEPQVISIRPGVIDGGGMVSASVTVAYADPGQASQA